MKEDLTIGQDDICNLKQVIYYVLETEEEDFIEQVLNEEIEPLPSTSKESFDETLDEYVEMTNDYESTSYENLDNKLEEIALMSHGHIYCVAAQTANKLCW
jgi:6-phosphogluconolactonase/glucosamine-6-phosphate isomerase/deaminase